jgi:hypothetical protein
MAYAQGSVVLAPATFKSGRRPYLVVSNKERPFYGDRYTVAVITSTERDTALKLSEGSLTESELKTYPSYVSPWSLRYSVSDLRLIQHLQRHLSIGTVRLTLPHERES